MKNGETTEPLLVLIGLLLGVVITLAVYKMVNYSHVERTNRNYIKEINP